MSVSEASSVEERIQLLEEQNDALKRSGLFLLVLVLVMGVTMIYRDSTQQETVQTGGLILTNAGDPRGAITTMPSGHLGMVFYDHQGNLPQSLQSGAIPYLDGFAIYDRNGKPRILIGMDDQDNPIIAAVGADGKTLFSAVPRSAPTESANPNQPAATPTPASTPLPASTPTPNS